MRFIIANVIHRHYNCRWITHLNRNGYLDMNQISNCDMAIISFKNRLRPVKIGLIIENANKAELKLAMNISAFLWGGTYNPIIPWVKKSPKHIKSHNYGYSLYEINQNIIEAFDPDVLAISDSIKDNIEPNDRRVISLQKLNESIENGFKPEFGLGIFELLEYRYKTEYRFHTKNPEKIVWPKLAVRNNLFLTASIGSVSNIVSEGFDDVFGERIDYEKKDFTLNNFFSFYENRDNKSPLFFGKQYLDKILRFRWQEGFAIFVLDANNFWDIVNYWNLRALGWRIFPFPTQLISSTELHTVIDKVLEQNSASNKWNPSPLRTKIFKSDEVSKAHFDAVIKKITHNNRTEIHPSIPRYWIPQFRQIDSNYCCEVFAEENGHSFDNERDSYELKQLRPEFMISEINRKYDTIQFVNEVTVRVIGSISPVAEVIPVGSTSFKRGMYFRSNLWRATKRGVAYYSSDHDDFRFSFVESSGIISEWVKKRGYNMKISDAGIVANQMYRQLGGKDGLMMTLQRKGMPELLNEIGKKASVKYDSIKGELSKISNSSKYKTRPAYILEHLLEQNILSPGFQLTCPVCRKEHWVESDGLKRTVKCQKCLSDYPVPFHFPNTIAHAYKSIGTFSLRDYGQGAFTVLLVLNFFAETMDYECTLAFSSTLTNTSTGKQLEFDLGLLVQDSRMEYSEPNGVFVECKSHNSFLKKDVEKMKMLGKEFPFSVLVFSSLKDRLDSKEKKLIQNLFEFYQKRADKGQTFCYIMVLTSNELFLHDKPPYGWDDLGTRHKKHAKKWNYRIKSVIDLCFATTELYLK